MTHGASGNPKVFRESCASRFFLSKGSGLAIPEKAASNWGGSFGRRSCEGMIQASIGGMPRISIKAIPRPCSDQRGEHEDNPLSHANLGVQSYPGPDKEILCTVIHTTPCS
jgi:hypothetical protein